MMDEYEEQIDKALRTLVSIMTSSGVDDAARMEAAQFILRYHKGAI